MENVNKIVEIDISKLSGALSLLRLADYALVVLCGSVFLGSVLTFFDSATYDDTGSLITNAILASCFGFAALTGWRHVGVIDPNVWTSYRIVFPLLIVCCTPFLVLSIFSLQQSAWNKENEVEFIQQLTGGVAFAWIGGAAALGWLSLRTLRRMTISGLNSNVEQLLDSLSSKAGPRAEKAANIRRINPTRGSFIGFAGVMTLMVLTFMPLSSNKELANAWLRSSDQIRLIGFFLLVRARRYFQVDADSLLAVDHRPAILFLRSFDDDEKQTYKGSDKALLDFSLETRLSNHFSRFGPFIAVGSPKEAVPQLGAARVLMSDDEWQPKILSWMQSAQLIVMYSGRSYWVNWELRQILNHGCTTRLLLMIPEIKGWRQSKRKADLDARVAHIHETFKGTPWEEELMRFDDFMGLRAMLFCEDGSVVVVKSRSQQRDAYHLSALIAHHLLLDPESVTLSTVQLPTKSKFHFAKVVSVTLAGVLAIAVGSVFLLKNGYGDKLTFKKGELYYQSPVTQEEAMRVGEYLVAQEYFSEEKPATVQLVGEGNGYEIRFVVQSIQNSNLFTDIIVSWIGQEVARELLKGAPVRVALADAHLKPIKVLPKYDKKLFGKGELYFSDKITIGEVDGVGQALAQIGFFSQDKATSAYVGKTGEDYELRLVVDSGVADDAKMRGVFSEIGQKVSANTLGNSPIVVSLCDSTFNILWSNRVKGNGQRN